MQEADAVVKAGLSAGSTFTTVRGRASCIKGRGEISSKTNYSSKGTK